MSSRMVSVHGQPEPAIVVKNVSKTYSIFRNPRQRLIHALLRRIGMKVHEPKSFAALSDVSFVVHKGETYGIIGHNGAGKSTLLKVLTGITTQTSGLVKVRGRITSLLELGAAFNPELTGRENVIQFGILSGMTRSEIENKIPLIQNFAEIGAHFDYLVKNYSSGMFVRLAFSAALLTEPDVLIVDEALSVGDAAFQRKSFDRIRELKKAGVTIILVSHALDQIKMLCDRALLIDHGKMILEGTPSDVVVRYLKSVHPEVEEVGDMADQDSSGNSTVAFSDGKMTVVPNKWKAASGFGRGLAKIDQVELSPLGSGMIIRGGTEVTVKIRFSWEREEILKLIREERLDSNISIGFAVSDVHRNFLFGCNTFDSELRIDPSKSAAADVEMKIKFPRLKSSTYFATLAVALGDLQSHSQLRWYDALFELEVSTDDRRFYGTIAVDYEANRIEATP